MAIDLVVIHPGAAHGIYGELGDKLVAVEPPVWARIIAGYARDHNLRVRVIDAEAHGLGPNEVAHEVRHLNPALACIAVYGHQPSASTQQMYGAGLTAKELRRIAPDVFTIMVGGHVAALPERTLEEEAVDFVCNSEGPVTVVELTKALKAKQEIGKIPGLVYALHDARGGRTVINNPAPPLLDINDLHGFVWDILPMDRYRAHNWQCFGNIGERHPYASIFTSLGCPYACSFCCINAPFHSHRYRMRNPGDVAWEVQHLYARYGVRTFKIVDEMFVLNERHYTEIARRLEALAIPDLNIWAYARVDTVKAGHLDLLRRGGIRWLALGIESASKYVLDGSNKRLKNNEIAEVVESIQRAGISVIGNFIFGLPDDDEQSMRDTLELAKSLRLDFANFYSAMAYPGSPLYTEALNKGWTLPATWRGYSQHNDDCRPLDTLHTSANNVLAFRDKAFNEFFRDKTFLARTAQKFGRETEAHVKEMTRYELKRKLLTGEIA